MKRSLLLFISFILALTAPLLNAAKAEKPPGQATILQDILILNSYHPGYAWSDDEQAGIIDVFRAKDKNWLPVIEYMDLKRLPDGRHLAELKKLFRLKYQNQKFSVVITMDNPALEFAIKNQAELFRNAPIVFCGINNYKPSMLKGHPDVTGIVESIDLAETIKVMLRLHPKTREILVIHDHTATGLEGREEIEALAPRFVAQVRLRFLDRLSMDEVLNKLENLPNDNLVLLRAFTTDSIGHTFGLSDSTQLFTKHSPVPVYAAHERRLGFGIVGGKLLSGRIQGADAARIALRVLAGEKAPAIPVDLQSDSKFMFDYKVMSRFGIPLSALPEASTVINKPVSFYAAHRVVIQTALGVIVFMTVVISLLTINIIQRRRSSEVIRRSNELLNLVTSNTPDHLIVQDRDLRYLFVMNPQLGLTEQDMIGKTDYDILSKEDADKLTEIKRQVLKTGHPVEVEVSLTSSNEEQQFFEGTYIPKFYAKGEIDGLIGYFRNVTDRKRAEKQLRLNEARLLEAQRNARIGDWEWNLVNGELYWSAENYRIFGLDPDKVLPTFQAFMETVDPQYRQLVQESVDAALRGEKPYDIDFPIIRPDGQQRSVTAKAAVKFDEFGQAVMMSGFVQDITERKKAEEALKESEKRFRELVENINDVHYELDEQGIIQYTSPSVEHLLGYRQAETVGMSIKDFLVSEDVLKALKNIQGSLHSEIGPQEYRIHTKSLETRWIRVLSSPIRKGDKVVGIRGILSDITERKKAEEELRKSEERFRDLSIIDNLTQLYNVRHFYHQLKIESNRVNRYGQPLTLMLIDIDDFKRFNDAYGHIEGDQVLLRLGQVIKRCLRQTDSAYRYGGEEFTILLPMTTVSDGAVSAERIRAELKREHFSPAPGQDVHVTVSIGITQYKPQEDIKTFIHRVDQLMYQGKKNGKDEICSEL